MTRVFEWFDRAQRWLLQPLFVVLVIAGGVLGARSLSRRGEAPQRTAAPSYAPLVRSQIVATTTERAIVGGHGTLEPRSRIRLVPQVGGEVIAVHSALRAGGIFPSGATLFQVDPRDYELDLARAEADVAAATTVVQEIDARAATARAEWSRLHPEREAPTLVALVPQVDEARARLAAAVAARERSRLNLTRTEIVARFDGRVVTADVDVGQVVAAGQAVAEVYALDVLELAVALEPAQLRWIRFPGDARSASSEPRNAAERALSSDLHDGPTAVSLEIPIDGSLHVVQGRVARLEAELTRGTRLARVIVELDLTALPAALRQRVVPGLFVAASFQGTQLNAVTALPRAAIHQDGLVWTVEEGRLRFVRPEVLHRYGEELLVRGLVDGARIVTSDLEVVTDGMHVRLEAVDPKP